MFLNGEADDAGFVQLIEGKLTDRERFRHYMEQPMDTLQRVPARHHRRHHRDRPGRHLHRDDRVPDEEAAREGERKEMPAEAQREYADEMAMQGAHLDLHHPWFASKT